MQTRRHVMVAALIVSTQILSLVVATEILGADVSAYATPTEAIEAVGTESDVQPDETGIGQDVVPDQLALLDLTTDAVEETATPPIVEPTDEPDPADQAQTDGSEWPGTDPVVTSTTVAASSGTESAGTEPAVTSTTVAESSGAESSGTESSGTEPAVTSPTVAESPAAETVTAEAATESSGDSRPVGSAASVAQSPDAGQSAAVIEPPVSSTTVPAPPATTTLPVASTGSTTVPTTPAPQPAAPPTVSSTTAPALRAAATQSTALPTTWLPVTTRNVITTWPTTTTTAPIAATTTTTTAPPPTSRTPVTTRATTTTAPPTTVASTTQPTAPPPTAAPGGTSANNGLEAIRNDDPRFRRYATVRSDQLSVQALTEPSPVRDNGSVGDGQFRAACQYSHFAYDDPIIYPNQPGRSHLHMFFGNTDTNAFSTTDSIVNSGGGTCNGFELNRSAYWTPALLDGRGNAVVPDMIILYYKSKQTDKVQRMPQGLKMVVGNTSAESFTKSDFLYWSCGDSGFTYNKSNRIPNCNGDTINATVAFPQCWDGRNLDSADHRSHMAMVSPHKPCPSSHPVRLPQISILLYFPGQRSVDGWHLSSDRSGGFNTGPGATLHADWWGGWNDATMDLWTNGCMKAARNCSFGQTGTDRQLAKLNNFQNYPGENFLPLP